MIATIREWLARLGRAVLAGLAWVGRQLWRPFAAIGRYYWRRRWWLRIALAVLVVPWLIGNLHFFWHVAFIRDFDLAYAEQLGIAERRADAGKPVPLAAGGGGTPTCGQSFIAAAAADLIDFNVNRNLWISSNPFYKMGFLFAIDWERTKFFDNKAAFQRGVHQAVARTATELADTLGRVRGTSEIDSDLALARGNLQFDAYTWVLNPFSPERPFGPTTRTAKYYRDAADLLLRYNARLERCEANFDERADNLLQFIDRIASDIGSTSATLMQRAETHNSGWFDTRADDMFAFAQGQLYAYYGILQGARADFGQIVQSREISNIWNNLEEHLRHAISLNPWIISNGAEDGWIMPSHLTTLGFYVLRARSNLVEIRSVLDR